MSVFVDNMEARFRSMILCHMIADSTEELLEMADQIGVARKWIQKQGTPEEHFDIAKSKRRLSIKLGAIEISMEELVRILQRRRSSRKVKEVNDGYPYYNEACALCGRPADIHKTPEDKPSGSLNSTWGDVDSCRNFTRCRPARAAYGMLGL